MARDEKPEEERNDVLSNLPRSRRQRPSARREESRAARGPASSAKASDSAGANGGTRKEESGKGAAKKAPATGKAAPAAAAEGRERPRRRVPASGYATVHEPGSYGNADPDELLKSFVRSILRRLPG